MCRMRSLPESAMASTMFFVPVFSGYNELEVFSYDRWGEEIYHYNTLDGGWDGFDKEEKWEEDVTCGN